MGKELSRRIGKLAERHGTTEPLCIRFLRVLRPDLPYGDQERRIAVAEALVLGTVERERIRAPVVCSHTEAPGIVVVDATGAEPVVREEERRW